MDTNKGKRISDALIQVALNIVEKTTVVRKKGIGWSPGI